MIGQEPVIIVGPDGTEHEFPPGMDPKRAAEIVRSRSGSSGAVPTRPSLSSLAGQGWKAALATSGPVGTGMSWLGDMAKGIYKDPESAAPMVTGSIGGKVAGPMGAAVGGLVGNPLGNILRIARNKNLDKVPTTIGGSLLGAGKEAAIQGTIQKVPDVLGRIFPKALRSGAKNIEEGVLKPTQKAINSNPDIDLVETVLNNRIKPWDKRSVIEKMAPLNAQRRQLLDDATQRGATGDLNTVAKGLDQWVAEHQAVSPTPSGGTNAARKIAEELTNHPAYPTGQVPASKISSMKEGVNVEFGEGTGKNVASDLEKRLRNLLKVEAENAVPGLKEVNADLSPLLAVNKLVRGGKGYGKGSAARIGSREALGWQTMGTLGGGLGGGVGIGSLTGDPLTGGLAGAAIAAGISAARHPKVQGTVAQKMWDAAKVSEFMSRFKYLPEAERLALLSLMTRSGKTE